jgi:hypothetical protein
MNYRVGSFVYVNTKLLLKRIPGKDRGCIACAIPHERLLFTPYCPTCSPVVGSIKGTNKRNFIKEGIA